MLGTTVGKYRVTAMLGEGGMGEVYAVYNDELEKRAVIKVLRPHLSRDEEIAKRFVNEARAAARIHHAGIVDVLDIDRLDNGGFYILMEFLDGEVLSARLSRVGALPEATALSLLRQAAEALAAAHDKGIVHRDLKPDNIFLVPDSLVPDGERLKLLDFGIAKLLEGQGSLMTKSGAIMGTPAYMSPEQCRSADKADHRSDLYSLGVILFEMLCGQLPFVKQSAFEYMLAHVSDPAPSIKEHQPAVSDMTADVTARLLAKEPEDRFATVRDLIVALDEAARSAPARASGAEPELPADDDALDTKPLLAVGAHGDRLLQTPDAALASGGRSPADPDGPTTLFKPVGRRTGAPVPGALLSDAEPALASRSEGLPAAALVDTVPEMGTASPAKLARHRELVVASVAAVVVGVSISVIWAVASRNGESGPGEGVEAAGASTTAASVQPDAALDKSAADVEMPPIPMAEIPGGAFNMGSEKEQNDRDGDELLHRVKLSAFQIAEREITQKQWKMVMGTNPSDCDRGCGDDLPVQNVSWLAAVRFLNALSEREKLKPCYAISGEEARWDRSCNGYRLPTEAEWEYACRAGTKTPYSFGDNVLQLGEYAWYGGYSDYEVQPVASKESNAWGLYDMHGNVWEWVWDRYGPYPTEGARVDPGGPSTGESRLLRGGSITSSAADLRCAKRVRDAPDVRDGDNGLRVARSVL